MNRRINLYYPILLYAMSLLIIWIVSWFAGVLALFFSGDFAVNSLISAEGVRWALRTAMQTVNSAPWGVAMLCVMCVGLLSGSGLLHSICNLLVGNKLSYNNRFAGYMALVVLCICLFVVFLSTVAPWHLLMGVTPHFSLSPLVRGWLLLLFVVTFLTSSLYGAVSGSYRCLSDVLNRICDVYTVFAPAFIAMIPASGILPCMGYVGILPDEFPVTDVETVLYLLPFIYVAFLSRRYFLRAL